MAENYLSNSIKKTTTVIIKRNYCINWNTYQQTHKDKHLLGSSLHYHCFLEKMIVTCQTNWMQRMVCHSFWLHHTMFVAWWQHVFVHCQPWAFHYREVVGTFPEDQDLTSLWWSLDQLKWKIKYNFPIPFPVIICYCVQRQKEHWNSMKFTSHKDFPPLL